MLSQIINSISHFWVNQLSQPDPQKKKPQPSWDTEIKWRDWPDEKKAKKENDETKTTQKKFASHIINDVDHIKTIFRRETSKCRVAKKYHTKKKLRIWVIIQVLADFLHAHRARHDRNLNETCVSISGSTSNLFIKLKPSRFFFLLLVGVFLCFFGIERKSNKVTENKRSKPSIESFICSTFPLLLKLKNVEEYFCLPTWRQSRFIWKLNICTCLTVIWVQLEL
jgi:hypothetical protein